MFKRHNILPTRVHFFISNVEKLRAWGNSKQSFSSSSFIADDSDRKIICPHTVLSEHAIL